DYSFGGRMRDMLEEILNQAKSAFPVRQPPLTITTPPAGGLRGDNDENVGGMRQQIQMASSALSDDEDPGSTSPPQRADKPELCIPSPIFFPSIWPTSIRLMRR